MISVHFQHKPFNITIIQVYAQTSKTEESEVESVYEDLQDLLELTPKKDVLFIIWDRNAKVCSHEISVVTEQFGLEVLNEKDNANRVLPRELTGHNKHPLPTTQEKTLRMDTAWRAAVHGVANSRTCLSN